MTRPGPKPVPTSLHKLRGTYNPTRHKRGRAGEVSAPGELGDDPPDWLSDSQKESWRYAIAHAPRGILKPIDHGLLAVWVVAEDLHKMAMISQAKLDRGSSMPLLTKGRDGAPVPSPYLRIINRAAQVLLRVGPELGFTPSARAGFGRGNEPPLQPNDPTGGWARLQLLTGGKPPATPAA